MAVTVPDAAALTGRSCASNIIQGCKLLQGWLIAPSTGGVSAAPPETFRNTSADSGMSWRTKVSSPMESSRSMRMLSAFSMPSEAFSAQGWRMLPSASTPSSTAQAMALLRSRRSARLGRGFGRRGVVACLG